MIDPDRRTFNQAPKRNGLSGPWVMLLGLTPIAIVNLFLVATRLNLIFAIFLTANADRRAVSFTLAE